MLGQTFSKCIIMIDYTFNKASIAKNLCENKDKPQLKCEGKCYLCKRLKKEDDKNQQEPDRNPLNKFEIISGWTAFNINHPVIVLAPAVYTSFQEKAIGTFSDDLFRPPRT
jgi:hypothetical protein